MAGFQRAVQLVGTLTASASGTATFVPAKSNSPFKNLSICVVPQEDPSPYQVDVYHDGEILESQNFSSVTDRVVAHLSYPEMIFPANIGTNAIPKFYDANRKDYYGVPVRVTITNNSSSTKTYFVYALFEEMDNCSFGEITQES